MLDYGTETNLAEMDVNSLWHSMIQHKPFSSNPPRRMEKGMGCYVKDAEGKEYFDGISGLWCVNIGYGRKELAEVAYEQILELSYYPLIMSHTPGIQLAGKLMELLGFEGKVHFSSSGSEANEVAFKLARQYHAQTNPNGGWRYKIISRYRAYHGNTMGALSATAQAERRSKYEPLVPGFLHVQPPYCYRCPFGKTYGSCQLECATSIESTIVHEGAESIAAIIMEPVISGGGVIVPPDEYLPMVREICDRHGIVLIFDEVVSGFGRLGKMFGHQVWDVKPDIISLAKGITSGYLPLAATAVQQHIFEAFLDEPGTDAHFRHISTYGGHPASSAVALKNIEIMEAEQLADRAARMGDYLLDKLRSLLDHPLVGDVRGKGLLLGMELVSNKATKTPLETSKLVAITQACMAHGVIIGRNVNTIPGMANVLIMAPPLVMTEADADALVTTLQKALDSQL
jgi:adenosylmethionine-8-amino-7-oxononanoate aminotransferase